MPRFGLDESLPRLRVASSRVSSSHFGNAAYTNSYSECLGGEPVAAPTQRASLARIDGHVTLLRPGWECSA